MIDRNDHQDIKAKMKKMTILMPSWASVLFSTSFNVGHSCRLNYTFREHKSKMLHILPKQEPQKKKKSVFLVRKKKSSRGPRAFGSNYI